MLSAGYPPGASAPAPLELLQDAHALVIGVSAYLHVPALPRTSDAEDIAAALVDPQLCAYHPAKVRTVLEHEATRARLVEELIGLARRTTAESTVLIYFSGHGCTVPASSQCFLMPVDAKAQSRAEPRRAASAGA